MRLHNRIRHRPLLTSLLLTTLLLCLSQTAFAAAKPKVVTLGRWSNVKWVTGDNEENATEIKIRPLLVDGATREFTMGEAHDVTEHQFVVRRIVKINDALPPDANPRWRWQPAGWLLVDRSNAHISKLPLPDFDPFYSMVSWYRDLAAYCGLVENGDKVYAVVVQIGQRKALLRKALGPFHNGATPESECGAPVWQRQPVRVAFQPTGAEKVTFAVRGRAVELAPETAAGDEDPGYR